MRAVISSLVFVFFPFYTWGHLAASGNTNPWQLLTKNVVYPEVKYYVIHLAATQERASLTCKTFGTELVSIPDSNRNEVIKNLIVSSGENYWTSGKKMFNDKWVWWQHLPMTYTNWAIGQPNNFRGCLQLLPSGEWSEEDCNTEQYFICEGPKSTYKA